MTIWGGNAKGLVRMGLRPSFLPKLPPPPSEPSGEFGARPSGDFGAKPSGELGAKPSGDFGGRPSGDFGRSRCESLWGRRLSLAERELEVVQALVAIESAATSPCGRALPSPLSDSIVCAGVLLVSATVFIKGSKVFLPL